MKSKLLFLGLVMVLGALILGACCPPPPNDTGLANPASVYCEEQGYRLEMRTDADGGIYGVCVFPDGSECEEWAFFRGECGPGSGSDDVEETVTVPDPAAARDLALAYIAANYGGQVTVPDAGWTEENITNEGLVGASTFQYTAGSWVVKIGYAVLPPEQTTYQVSVINEATGFWWEGVVDAAGQVTEPGDVGGGGSGLPVVGWLGCVVGLPAGSQFDDYVVLMPEGAGDVGIEGTDEAIQAQIVALRDKEEPGKYAHFWGTLTCDVIDYGGCQLLVSRVRVGTEIADTEPVEAWEGTIVGTPPGSQFDDYFVLVGGFPVGYGIGSIDPAIREQLATFRDTGVTVRVWGQLRAGVPDAFGSQIDVTRIEAMGDLPTPAPESGAVVDGWAGSVVKLPPGNQHGQYFQRIDGESFGIGTSDEALRAQIGDAAWTGAQIRVWGELFTGVPAVEARHIEVERIEVVAGSTEELRNLSPFAAPTASSALPSDRGGTYFAAAAIDGLTESSWVEGVDGPGAGEWILLTFPGAVEVHRIGIDVGFDRDDDIFAKNNRLQKAIVRFSNGASIELTFSDVRGVQVIDIDPVETTYVQIIIEEVYPGTEYDDTCVAEVEVWGRVK
jgi:putative hemolysin